MQSARARGIAAAHGLRGTVVVIDVLRAFTTAAHALAAGASAIELVSTPEEGLARKRADPGLVLVGEVGGRPIPGFDFGNSPEAMAGLDLRGRRLVLRSSSGVQGVLAAAPTCQAILLGSLVTASATVRAIRALGHEVTLLAMGAGGADRHLDGLEDDACAELLEARLEGRELDLAEVERRVRAAPSARAAVDPSVDWITAGDLERALEIDRFDFAIEARREGEGLMARKRRERGG